MPGCMSLLCCLTHHFRPTPLSSYGVPNLDGVNISSIEMTAVTEAPRQTMSNQMEPLKTAQLGRNGSSSSSHMENITQMHAAAVNGDKTVLSRLLAINTEDMMTGDQFGRTPLMFCMLADRLDCAEMLIKAGTFIDQKDRGGRTALHWAAHKGNFRLMKMLISKGTNIREKDNEGQTALHLCTRHKSAKCMAILLKQLTTGEIDDQDKKKRTALHWACSFGNLEHCRMLIKQDSNIGIPDIDGKTPLHWAASSRDPEAVDCVKLVLETSPSVINWQDYEGRTALHLAVADGNQDIVNILTMGENCNLSALDNAFRTPLHWAAVLGHSKIVNIMLNSNADYSSSDANGATPLHYAAQNNYDDTMEVFLSRCGVTDEPDIEGRTAFMWAAGKGADDVIKAFLRHSVDIHQVDKTGGTGLHAAALSGHASTVKLLLESDALIDASDLMKHTPLFRACEIGHMDVVQTLIDSGARVDILDQDGRSPLHWAALGGHAYICQTLIKYGVDPNIGDHSRRVPLQCAAYGGFVNCMSLLMENKADTNAQDIDGRTALHWACSKGHLDAVKLLIEYDAFPNHMDFTEDRYTPMDYALMSEHHEVAQYIIEQGALSITGIQDIAAQKIQSVFRGYRVRKTFIDRKQLLMKHEQLKKEAAKKRASEKKGDDDRCRDSDDPESSESATLLPRNDSYLEQIPEVEDEVDSDTVSVMRENRAARRIQCCWKSYKENKEAARKKTEIQNEWERQFAALTIQLAWRKYYRKKLLKTLASCKRKKKKWDPEFVVAKQRSFLEQIYSQRTDVPFWHPGIKSKPGHPVRAVSTPAASSYDFAAGVYHPLSARGLRSSSSLSTSNGQLRKSTPRPASRRDNDSQLTDKLRHVRVSTGHKHDKFSYNMSSNH